MFGVWYGGGMVNTIRPSGNQPLWAFVFPIAVQKDKIVSKSKATVKYILFIFSYLSVLFERNPDKTNSVLIDVYSTINLHPALRLTASNCNSHIQSRWPVDHIQSCFVYSAVYAERGNFFTNTIVTLYSNIPVSQRIVIDKPERCICRNRCRCYFQFRLFYRRRIILVVHHYQAIIQGYNMRNNRRRAKGIIVKVAPGDAV